ncbi:MAG: ABC transporter ATP-binding protein [Burkholderiales bacterium]|nr:ABC transporter ATP-binding protein [Burkholderiales bacterium]
MNRTPLLEARALTLRAAGRVLVEDLAWRVHAGERWCVIGRNGAGKSLVLRALAGLSVPERSGDVLWQGRSQGDWPAGAAASLRALMAQQAQDRFALTVERVLALSEVAGGAPPASELLSALDIAGLDGRRVDQLSGGERQRVALAQCAMQGAALMLLDEPVSFQDPAHQQVVGRWLTQAATPASGARAWVASAHDPSWIARVATHVLALSGDGGWQAGRVEEILSAPVLERTYGCAWRSVEGAWLPD